MLLRKPLSLLTELLICFNKGLQRLLVLRVELAILRANFQDQITESINCPCLKFERTPGPIVKVLNIINVPSVLEFLGSLNSPSCPNNIVSRHPTQQGTGVWVLWIMFHPIRSILENHSCNKWNSLVQEILSRFVLVSLGAVVAEK